MITVKLTNYSISLQIPINGGYQKEKFISDVHAACIFPFTLSHRRLRNNLKHEHK